MGVELRLHGDKLTALLSGEIDHHNGAKLREAIDEKVSQTEPSELVLDFSRVTFMDSSGIGLILGRYRWMRNLGGAVRITHIPPRMEQILVLSGIHKLVQVEAEKEEEPNQNLSDHGITARETVHTESRDIFSDSSKEVKYRAK